ncbi:hypothetical protein BO70DRAFT_41995 [Aspergillus heteromorphus CBS 117.55]|uniref:Uncharacterized protein n=1 Tax=Aspergillus heteromorphus CBS 117.55 TaxID=1448321 RepID=A0A317W5Q7_9EURO|nr:uncharacterized protein BO70DRAFT_41995 [Aspergillus heteromorphus CBS 117.55]PWY81914.1 hypothetical protein BO70DRAFT_41995 [Aspergillus heteromorphus CBS 117.55]
MTLCTSQIYLRTNRSRFRPCPSYLLYLEEVHYSWHMHRQDPPTITHHLSVNSITSNPITISTYNPCTRHPSYHRYLGSCGSRKTAKRLFPLNWLPLLRSWTEISVGSTIADFILELNNQFMRWQLTDAHVNMLFLSKDIVRPLFEPSILYVNDMYDYRVTRSRP